MLAEEPENYVTLTDTLQAGHNEPRKSQKPGKAKNEQDSSQSQYPGTDTLSSEDHLFRNKPKLEFAPEMNQIGETLPSLETLSDENKRPHLPKRTHPAIPGVGRMMNIDADGYTRREIIFPEERIPLDTTMSAIEMVTQSNKSFTTHWQLTMENRVSSLESQNEIRDYLWMDQERKENNVLGTPSQRSPDFKRRTNREDDDFVFADASPENSARKKYRRISAGLNSYETDFSPNKGNLVVDTEERLESAEKNDYSLIQLRKEPNFLPKLDSLPMSKPLPISLPNELDRRTQERKLGCIKLNCDKIRDAGEDSVPIKTKSQERENNGLAAKISQNHQEDTISLSSNTPLDSSRLRKSTARNSEFEGQNLQKNSDGESPLQTGRETFVFQSDRSEIPSARSINVTSVQRKEPVVNLTRATIAGHQITSQPPSARTDLENPSQLNGNIQNYTVNDAPKIFAGFDDNPKNDIAASEPQSLKDQPLEEGYALGSSRKSPRMLADNPSRHGSPRIQEIGRIESKSPCHVATQVRKAQSSCNNVSPSIRTTTDLKTPIKELDVSFFIQENYAIEKTDVKQESPKVLGINSSTHVPLNEKDPNVQYSKDKIIEPPQRLFEAGDKFEYHKENFYECGAIITASDGVRYFHVDVPITGNLKETMLTGNDNKEERKNLPFNETNFKTNLIHAISGPESNAMEPNLIVANDSAGANELLQKISSIDTCVKNDPIENQKEDFREEPQPPADYIESSEIVVRETRVEKKGQKFSNTESKKEIPLPRKSKKDTTSYLEPNARIRIQSKSRRKGLLSRGTLKQMLEIEEFETSILELDFQGNSVKTELMEVTNQLELGYFDHFTALSKSNRIPHKPPIGSHVDPIIKKFYPPPQRTICWKDRRTLSSLKCSHSLSEITVFEYAEDEEETLFIADEENSPQLEIHNHNHNRVSLKESDGSMNISATDSKIQAIQKSEDIKTIDLTLPSSMNNNSSETKDTIKSTVSKKVETYTKSKETNENNIKRNTSRSSLELVQKFKKACTSEKEKSPTPIIDEIFLHSNQNNSSTIVKKESRSPLIIEKTKESGTSIPDANRQTAKISEKKSFKQPQIYRYQYPEDLTQSSKEGPYSDPDFKNGVDESHQKDSQLLRLIPIPVDSTSKVVNNKKNDCKTLAINQNVRPPTQPHSQANSKNIEKKTEPDFILTGFALSQFDKDITQKQSCEIEENFPSINPVVLKNSLGFSNLIHDYVILSDRSLPTNRSLANSSILDTQRESRSKIDQARFLRELSLKSILEPSKRSKSPLNMAVKDQSPSNCSSARSISMNTAREYQKYERQLQQERSAERTLTKFKLNTNEYFDAKNGFEKQRNGTPSGTSHKQSKGVDFSERRQRLKERNHQILADSPIKKSRIACNKSFTNQEFEIEDPNQLITFNNMKNNVSPSKLAKADMEKKIISQNELANEKIFSLFFRGIDYTNCNAMKTFDRRVNNMIDRMMREQENKQKVQTRLQSSEAGRTPLKTKSPHKQIEQDQKLEAFEKFSCMSKSNLKPTACRRNADFEPESEECLSYRAKEPLQEISPVFAQAQLARTKVFDKITQISKQSLANSDFRTRNKSIERSQSRLQLR